MNTVQIATDLEGLRQDLESLRFLLNKAQCYGLHAASYVKGNGKYAETAKNYAVQAATAAFKARRMAAKLDWYTTPLKGE